MSIIKLKKFLPNFLKQKGYIVCTKKIIILSIAGVFIGAINGFFGGGGGMVCVPVLLLLGLVNQRAQATAILIMLPISIASAIVYYTQGFVEWEGVL